MSRPYPHRSIAAALREWWSFVGVPLGVLGSALLFVIAFRVDIPLARSLFFEHHAWIGAHSWWTNQFAHAGGRGFVWTVVVAASLLYLATYMRAPIAWRRPTGYFVLACVLGIGVTGLLKTALHVPCPWDLRLFGGHVRYVPLFVRRLSMERFSGCFPAAHAASGYALTSGYFVFRERYVRLARGALCVGIAAGLVFGIAQQSRGAHFLSHDLCSAILTWVVAASLYVFGFKSSLWRPLKVVTPQPAGPPRSVVVP